VTHGAFGLVSSGSIDSGLLTLYEEVSVKIYKKSQHENNFVISPAPSGNFILPAWYRGADLSNFRFFIFFHLTVY